ncbi:hypothetical protein QUA13_30655 [Microcoleus sp. S28C3]
MKEEGRRKKEEGRRKKEEGRREINWFPGAGWESRSKGSASLAKKQEAEQ